MISLHFTTQRVVSARYGNVPITVIRLKGWVKLRRADDTFGEARHAIIDTGAFVSIVPLHIWQGLAVSISADSVTFGGINPRSECQVPATLGQATGILVDRESVSAKSLSSLLSSLEPIRCPLFLASLTCFPNLRSASTTEVERPS